MATYPTLFNLSADNGFALQTSVMKNAFSIQKGATFQQQEIINRSSPVLTYASSTPMTLTVSLEFLADGQNLVAVDVSNIIKGLLSLTFPNQSGITPPPVCTITLGSGFVLQNWQSVCSTCQPTWGDNQLFSPAGDPLFATVALTFVGFEPVAVNSTTWAGNAIGAYQQLSY